jgi:acyl carrier protein
MIEKQAVRDFLTKLADKDIRIGDDDSLLAGRLLDSLMVIELIVFLESHYQVTFDNDELTPDNLDTINAIARLLERKGAMDVQL